MQGDEKTPVPSYGGLFSSVDAYTWDPQAFTDAGVSDVSSKVQADKSLLRMAS